MKPLLAALLLGAFSAASHADEKQLNLYNWADYFAKDTVPNFEKESGIFVRYDVYDGDETLQAKLLTGSTGYDVVAPTSGRPLVGTAEIGFVMDRAAVRRPGLPP
jgi:putrescine transport system substrate-binding protein